MAEDSDRCVARIVDYTKLPKEVLELCKKWLEHCADRYGGYAKLAVVFDIDETLLFTHKNDTHITHCPFGAALYKLCNDLGIEIHLVTARVGDNNSRRFVREQLACLNFKNYRSLYMVNKRHQDDPTPSSFKGKSRRTIVKQTGKVIALNVGDQMTDMFPTFDQPSVSQQVAQIIGPSTYYFIEVEDDVSKMSLKLPSDKDTYV